MIHLLVIDRSGGLGMHGIGMSILLYLYVVLVMVMGGGLAMGGDTLSKGESLTGSQTLTSKNGFFELGFFPPNPSISNGNKFYLSIRYIEFQDQKTIVWVANREKPLTGTTGSRLDLPSSGGNLQLYDGGGGSVPIWSAGGNSSPESMVVAVLSDKGNLILKDDRLGLVWQSFDHPTDTWLPGAELGGGRRLVSWRSDDDPSPGIFSAEVPESNARIVLKWKDKEGYGELQMDNNSKIPTQLSFRREKIGARVVRRLENRVSLINGTGGGAFSMVVLGHREGILTAVTSWRGGGQGAPERLRLTGTLCGANGVRYMTMTTSSSSSSKLCDCLPGYRPLSKSLMGWSCSREYPVDCEKKDEIFEEVSVFKLPDRGSYASTSEEDCGGQCLSKCSCKAYAFDDGAQCLTWDEDLVGTQQQQQEEDISSNRLKLYLRLATKPKPKGETKMMEVIIAVVVPVLVIAFGAFLGFFYNNYRTKHKHREMEVGEDLLSFDFNSSNETISRTRSFTNTNTNTNTEFDLPMFTYASVSAATSNFSPENKLGEGGFGPVYKGCLLNGQEIALKRLSQNSGQGFEEFRNEMLLIAKLQHRNLVRLLGCCIHPNECILIYEYLPNKSMDLFLFGSKKLDWMTRTRIIEGVAQGLLYLHEYSRVRIIHRDLKASNILLDDEMNPKISDFGMARIFAGNDSQAHTNKIVGTYGYIAPEYAMEGLFSIKSDVFSFGVLVLEIISGRKNTGFYKTDSLNLLGHAWDLWISGRGEELVDDKAGGSSSRALRYINVGLLCVQENPNERPNMSSVVSMLGSEIEALPQPKKPAFSASTLMTTSSSSVTKTDGDGGGGGDLCPSINGITVSDILPR